MLADLFVGQSRHPMQQEDIPEIGGQPKDGFDEDALLVWLSSSTPDHCASRI
jgi:hypothetical protein